MVKSYKWFVNIFIILVFSITLIKVCSLRVMASTLNASQYYGGNLNNYTIIGTSKYTKVTIPYPAFVFGVFYDDNLYRYFMCPKSYLINVGGTLGMYLMSVDYDLNGNVLGTRRTFHEMENIDNPNYVDKTGSFMYGDVEYCYRVLVDASNYIDIVFYQYPWSYSDVLPPCARTILDGNVAYKNHTVNLGDVNATIDTSNIEQLLQASNNINTSTDTSVKAIENSLSSGTVGGSGLTDSERDLLKRYDIWLLIIMFALVLSFFRQVLHQAGRNIRGM